MTQSRARVLIVHNYYQQAGGEDSVVANEKALLIQNGHDVVQYSVHNDQIVSLADKARVFLDISYSQRAKDRFAKKIRDVKPDVVHVHNFFPLLTTSIYDACKEAGVPVVQTLHNFRIMCAGVYLMRNGKLCEQCLGGNPYWGVVHRCYRGSAAGSLAVARMIDTNQRRGTWREKVDAFIALTASGKDRFVRAGLPEDRIIVKPNFAADPGEPSQAPRRGALYVGRLSAEKGVRELIAAWRNIDYPLTIAGDGPLGEELRASAPQNVTFLGQVSGDEVRRQMAKAAVLIVFSNCLEGFPVVLTEAFATGLPAIVSDIGAPPDIVRHGETGLHVPMGDVIALARTVNAIKNDTQALQRMGQAARQDYLKLYSPQENYRQLAAVYDKVRKRRMASGA